MMIGPSTHHLPPSYLPGESCAILLASALSRRIALMGKALISGLETCQYL
jgi:hypothetical protein